MYAIKIEFDTPTSMESRVKIIPYRQPQEAAGWFNYFSQAFLHTKPVPVKSGGTVDIIDASIYETDADTNEDAIKSVEAGRGHLIDHTCEPDFVLNLE